MVCFYSWLTKPISQTPFLLFSSAGNVRYSHNHHFIFTLIQPQSSLHLQIITDTTVIIMYASNTANGNHFLYISITLQSYVSLQLQSSLHLCITTAVNHYFIYKSLQPKLALHLYIIIEATIYTSLQPEVSLQPYITMVAIITTSIRRHSCSHI